MLEYDKTEVTEWIDTLTNGSHECIICHYCYFLEINFRNDPKVYNGCHDLMQRAMSFHDNAIVFVKGNDYRIHSWYISKDEGLNSFKKCWFVWKRAIL